VTPSWGASLAGRILDLVLLDLSSRELRPLTHDRARTRSRAGARRTYVLFRSDRDGIENVYALRLADNALLRVTRVLGGAFGPALGPDGRRLVYSEYTSRGYDLHAMDVSLRTWRRGRVCRSVSAASRRSGGQRRAGAAYHALEHLWHASGCPTCRARPRRHASASRPRARTPRRQSWALTFHHTSETGRLGFEAAMPTIDTEPPSSCTPKTRAIRSGTGPRACNVSAWGQPAAHTQRAVLTGADARVRGEQHDLSGGDASASRQRLSGWSFPGPTARPSSTLQRLAHRGQPAARRAAAGGSWLGSDVHVLKPASMRALHAPVRDATLP